VSLKIHVNGQDREIAAAPDTPLLYVLRNELGLRGPKFGCGLAQCGTCSVLVDRQEARSCVLPVEQVAGREVTTLEGLPALWADDKKSSTDSADLHPIQRAWVEEQVPQCGYCQAGMMIQAASLLHENPNPSTQDIRAAMDGHICRCGTYIRILRAVTKAAALMRGEG
jgi:aerobic-type carbon monoxide dehydrogenase small subunit (CoxS/CutS family)